VPATPVREELGLSLAKYNEFKKRNIKQKEKAQAMDKLKHTPKYQTTDYKKP
jgi:hypothetical protein